MEKLDGAAVTEEVTHLFAAKERRREALARLSFPQKVEAVIRLQQMAAPILRARGKIVQPWSSAATGGVEGAVLNGT